MATLPSSDLNVDGQLLSRIPVLVGQSNYAIWLMKIRNTLSTYGVWEIADGMLTYVSVPANITCKQVRGDKDEEEEEEEVVERKKRMRAEVVILVPASPRAVIGLQLDNAM